MALRLRRDVQKASYYVWFLGAEEAKGLRGARVINSVLPYLIDRSRSQEPLKVTLQVSHKGIKILQGSSKHFIPHSAITSSVQTNDIVACVLLLYNPATKCPLHVHAYRCDSESTAEALHQQLQVLINRAENQKRFEELETRLGIMPPMPSKSSSSYAGSDLGHKGPYHQSSHAAPPPQRERHETSPKRFSSSLGSDTGNSTRESECSEEHLHGSPLSRSPPIVKAHPVVPIVQNNELFDSLAAELRAKLNGNGPPLLLPPRDYDTVHRSKGNLTAIELRRCRNTLIVGNTTPSPTTGGGVVGNGGGVTTSAPVKQVSSRGSSGIGSDLAPSPERQDLNSSSDDEHWSNEADNSVIALKPSQIAMERSGPIIPHHPQLNRKSAIPPPEDSYLRDLPAKPYVPRHGPSNGNGKVELSRAKAPANGSTTSAWSREDEIKPIIMRPADYDAKFNRILQAEQKQDYPRQQLRAPEVKESHSKLRDTDKYNEINRLLSKKLSLERGSPEQIDEDFDDSDRASDHVPLAHRSALHYSKENLTDKQKFMEYSSTKKPVSKTYAAEEVQRYGGRHRYVDPADLPFEQSPPQPQPSTHGNHKYAAGHRGSSQHSGERADLGHRTAERERQRERPKEIDADERDGESVSRSRHSRERDRKNYSQSNERNPYREPESIPYIKSMEKMMKSSALRYKSYDAEPTGQPTANEESHTKVSQRSSKSYPKHVDELERPEREREYIRSRPEGPTKDRYKDAKNKFHAMERSGSRYDLTDKMDAHVYDTPPPLARSRGRGSVERLEKTGRVYEDWSDEEERPSLPPHTQAHAAPANMRTRSRSRDNLWGEPNGPSVRSRDIIPPRDRDYGYDMRTREPSNKRPEARDMRPDPREMRPEPRDMRPDPREMRPDPREMRPEPRYDPRYDARQNTPSTGHRERDGYTPRHRDPSEEYRRERMPVHGGRREYSPDRGSEYTVRSNENKPQRVVNKHGDGPVMPTAKGIANMTKGGYRHSYAEPVFARSGGRVGLAAVNPY